MNCPRCGNDLRRSKKDPSYGLCDNCRKRFIWKEGSDDYEEYEEDYATLRKQQGQPIPNQCKSRQPSGRKTSSEVQNNVFQTGRLVIGIISVILFFIVTLQSCVAGLGNALAETGEVSGSAGFLLSLCVLIAGIVTLCLRKKCSSSAFIVPAVFYIIGALLAAANVGSYSDLQIWAILSAFFGVLHLFFMFKAKNSSMAIAIIIPVAVMAIIIVFSSLGKNSKKADSSGENDATEKQQSNTDEQPQKKDIDDGTIDFTCDSFTIKYTDHEVSTDYEGNQCLIVYFDYTNTGEEAANAGFSSNVEAFQNGVSCDLATLEYGVNEANDNLHKDVQSGTTIKVAYAYEIPDLTEVQLEASEMINFSDEKDTMMLQLQ